MYRIRLFLLVSLFSSIIVFASILGGEIAIYILFAVIFSLNLLTVAAVLCFFIWYKTLPHAILEVDGYEERIRYRKKKDGEITHFYRYVIIVSFGDETPAPGKLSAFRAPFGVEVEDEDELEVPPTPPTLQATLTFEGQTLKLFASKWQESSGPTETPPWAGTAYGGLINLREDSTYLTGSYKFVVLDNGKKQKRRKEKPVKPKRLWGLLPAPQTN